MLNNSERSIFRRKAYEHYVQGQHKFVLLRLVSPPVFLFLWLLVGLLGLSGLVAWWGRIPVYTSGQSVIEEHEGNVVAIVFVAPEQLSKLRNGQQVQIEVGPGLPGTVATVEPEILSPSEIRQRYRLEGATALAVTRPSAVVTVRLALPSAGYAGSLGLARIETGTRRALSFLPGLDKLAGD